MTRELNDEKLTAYVLGELEEDEREAVEKALETDELARRNVAELRATARLAAEALASGGAHGLTDEQREEIKARAGQDLSAHEKRSAKKPRWVPVAAAAAVLVALVGASVGALIVFKGGRLKDEAEPTSFEMANRYIVLESGEHGVEIVNQPQGAQVTLDGHVGVRGRKSELSRNVRDELKAVGFIDDPEKVHWPGHDTEAYDHITDNPFLAVSQNPLSTFSIDVDTASYSNVRRYLAEGGLPPRDAVRIEEMVNYFSYDYAPPEGPDPFSVHVEVAESPYHAGYRMARIGLKGREVPRGSRPPSNLVFLLDVSGSMEPANKLPLLKKAMKMLVEQLDARDRIAIAVYAGASGLVLPSTPCDEREAILDALGRLEAGGSTNGGEGIRLAYDVAKSNFVEGGVNRVILATDGDFNVGVTNQGDLVRMIEKRAESGVFLTVLGFGMGNLKDSTLEKLADKGNGNYAYIDSVTEARKVLVEEMGGTLVTIAKDVKIQVEFNPAQVAAYRLVGYENRLLAAEDFNDDTKDAGEIGAGHTVTALYEIVPAGAEVDIPGVDPLKYQKPMEKTEAAGSGELFTLKLRYKRPDGETSKLLAFPVTDIGESWADASDDFRFAAAVAGFGMLLRDSPYKGKATFETVASLAREALGEDAHGYRGQLLELVGKAGNLAGDR